MDAVGADATTIDADAALSCDKLQYKCNDKCVNCDVGTASDTSRLSFSCSGQGACVVACASPYTSCGAGATQRCLDLKSDLYNCGWCDRACGTSNDPGTCNQGQCVAKAVASLSDVTGSFLIHTSGKMYFHDQKRVYRCDTPDCANREPLYTGTFEALPLAQGLAIASAGATSYAYFVGKQSGSSTTSLVRCALVSTCVEPEIYVSNMTSLALFGGSDSLFSFDGQKLFFIDVTANPASAVRYEIAKYKWTPSRFALTADAIFDASLDNGVHRVARTACPNPDTSPCSPNAFVDVALARPSTIEARSEVLYFNDATTGAIFSCPPSGCANPIAVAVGNQLGAASLHSDGSNLAWTYHSPNGLADEVRMCAPSGGACSASKVYAIASQQRNATQVRLGSKGTLYWFSTGADDSDAGSAAAIRRGYAPSVK